MNIKYFCCWIIFGLLSLPSYSQITLSNLFSDHMVLQRDQPVEFWGSATKNEKFSLKFNDVLYKIKADRQGMWSITIAAQSAGGPYQFIFEGKDNTVLLKDILFGDVWICSGQSNMQWQLNQTPFKETDTRYFDKKLLRLLQVNVKTDYLPSHSLNGEQWSVASPENIPKFSAVGYHFGKFIQQETAVPIGLISSNLGATSVEAWMSNEALMQIDQFNEEVRAIVERNKDFRQLRADFNLVKGPWEINNYKIGEGFEDKWYLPETDVSDWKSTSIPGFWEDDQSLNLQNHDGAVWMRKEFDLPDGFDQDSFLLSLTQIDDYDITWINGIQVGESYGRHNFRNYNVGRDVLKAKGNILVVRVFDIEGKGGFSTNAFWINGMIRGEWLIKKGMAIDASTFPKVELPNVSPFSSPGVLYNANIAPFTRLPIKGVIWYQGESNASRAQEYRTLFPALIEDWRLKWNSQLPFLFVQLANYYPEVSEPKQSFWAELREAQNLALNLPKVGMAVTIDIGEANDIHPRNKFDVGVRLGKSALHHAYGLKGLLSPRYSSVSFDEGGALIEFDHSKGLHSKDKYGYIRGFAIAGEDQKFVWAHARMDGEKIYVYNEKIKHPKAVRYGWSDNPGKLDLYNAEGLPASPFRTDNWPGSTDGLKYDSSKSRF